MNSFDQALQRTYGIASYLLKPEYLAMHLLPEVTWRLPEPNEHCLALTFDDGPHPTRTLEILDILSSTDTKATFFMIGKHIELYPEVAREVQARGHIAANHSWNHERVQRMDVNQLYNNLMRVEAVAANEGLSVRKIFRPPFGVISKSQISFLRSHGFEIVIGDVYPRDSNFATKGEIVGRVKDDVRDGSIVILHDGISPGQTLESRMHTPQALKEVIEISLQAGYKFTTLPAAKPQV